MSLYSAVSMRLLHPSQDTLQVKIHLKTYREIHFAGGNFFKPIKLLKFAFTGRKSTDILEPIKKNCKLG